VLAPDFFRPTLDATGVSWWRGTLTLGVACGRHQAGV